MNRLDRAEITCRAVVWAAIAAYVLFFGVQAVQRHNAFQSAGFDLGNVDQAVWNTRHGRPFAMTNIEGLTNRLGTHVEPLLPYLAVLYLAWSDPRALLLLQTVVLALGAWPVYLLARRATGQGHGGESPPPGGGLLAAVLALAYLLFPALQSANLSDFHLLALAPTFFLIALLCLETRRWGGLALAAVLTMMCKEDMALLVAALGLFALLARRQWRAGLFLGIMGLAWFVVAAGVLAAFDPRSVSPLASRYAALGSGPWQIVLSPLLRPGDVARQLFTLPNLGYVLNLLAPVAFLSLLAPQVLALALPSLAVNLLSSAGFQHELEGYYYGAPLAPVVVVSAAYGAGRLARRWPRLRGLLPVLAALVLAASLGYHYAHGYTPLSVRYPRYRYVVGNHQRLGLAMAEEIPAAASLTAVPRLVPHASQRRELHSLYVLDQAPGVLPARTEYCWLDVTNAWPLRPGEVRALVEKLLDAGYGIQQARDGWLLLRYGAPGRTLPEEFYDMARAPEAVPAVPLHLTFVLGDEPALELLGLDPTWQDEGVTFTFYWRAVRPLPPGLELEVLRLEGTGSAEPAGAAQPLITTTWYPPERWAAGETVAVSTLTWADGPPFRLALRVTRDGGRRLPIVPGSWPQSLTLYDRDTAACLLQVRGDRIDPCALDP